MTNRTMPVQLAYLDFNHLIPDTLNKLECKVE